MMRNDRGKKGYALITTVAVMVVIMALCSMLVAYSVYGRSLAMSSSQRYELHRDYSSVGNDFLADAENYGDGLLELYRARGYTPVEGESDAVEMTDSDGVRTVLRRETDTALDVCTVTVVYGIGADRQSAALTIPRGESPTDWLEPYTAGVTDGGSYRMFAGWDCDGDGKKAEYSAAERIPAVEEDCSFTAVYAEGSRWRLTLMRQQPDGSWSEMGKAYYFAGETLGTVLERFGGTAAENYRWFQRGERDVSAILAEAGTGSGACADPTEALEASQSGDTIELLQPLTEPLIVDRAVTILTTQENAPVTAAAGYVLKGPEGPDGSGRYRYEVEGMAVIYARVEEDGIVQTVEYRDSFSGILEKSNQIGGVGLFADPEFTIPGMALLGDVSLRTLEQSEVEVSLPITVMSDVTVDLGGKTLRSEGKLMQVEAGASLTVKNGTLQPGAKIVEDTVVYGGGMAVQNKGGSLTLSGVNVEGNLNCADGSALTMTGGALKGTLEAWGSGTVSVSGTVQTPCLLNGTVNLRGTVESEFAYCELVSPAGGTVVLNIESRTAAQLNRVWPLEETVTGSYTVREYASEEAATLSNLERIEHPVALTDTFCGDLTLYAASADTRLACFYDETGVPVKTVRLGAEDTLPAVSVLCGGEAVSEWNDVSDTRDSELFPVVSEEEEGTPEAARTVSFRYHMSDGTPMVVSATVRSGDRLILTYLVPGTTEPLFFTEGEQQYLPGTAMYRSYQNALQNGGRIGLVFFPIYASEALRWEASGENANEYEQRFCYTLIWPDGKTASATVHYGTLLQFAFCDAEGSVRTLFRVDGSRLEQAKASEREALGSYSAAQLDKGWDYDGTTLTLTLLHSANRTLEEDDTGWTAALERRVTGDRTVSLCGGEIHYRDSSGKAVVLTVSGVPADSSVIYALCEPGDRVLPEDREFVVSAYLQKAGDESISRGLEIYSRMVDSLKAALTEAPADGEGDPVPPTDKALREAVEQQLEQGHYYDRDSRTLLVFLFAEAEPRWFRLGASGAEAIGARSELFSAGSIGTVYAGQEGKVSYSLTRTASDGQVLQSFRVQVDDHRVTLWNQAF